MDEVKQFWDNVDYYRKLKGISWTALVGNDLEASRNGTRNSRLSSAYRIAKDLDMPLENLVTEDREMALDMAYSMVEQDLGMNRSDMRKASRILRAIYDYRDENANIYRT